MTLQRRIPTEDVLQIEDPAAQAPSLEPFFDLTHILKLLRVRWPIVFGTALIVTALTALSVYRMTPLYTANALVILDTQQNQMVNSTALASRSEQLEYYYAPSLIENQVQILYSRVLAGRVIDKLQLDKDPKFNPPPPAPDAAKDESEESGIMATLQRIDP